MNYKAKYYKYKAKYMKLKQTGMGNKRMTFYHGTPYDLKVLEPRVPRGGTDFQRQNAVFFTSDLDQAKIYALARDKERKRRGWAVYKGKLYTLEKFEFNKKGYVYVYTTDDYVVDENQPDQFAVLHKVKPDKKLTVYPDEIKHLHKVLDRNGWAELIVKIREFESEQ